MVRPSSVNFASIAAYSCNLAPRPMMKGKYVSEGMIFAADTADGGCSIPFYSDDTPVGARIH